MGREQAEQVLPRNTCALIKSFFGFKLSKVCPYVEACDFVIGETTCDGKKKAYEIFNDYKETFVLEIPHMKSPQGRMLWRREVRRLLGKIEEATGKKIDEERLKKGIEIVNAKRAVLQRLNSLRRADPAPISGRDALLINQVQFYDDPLRFTEKIAALCDEIEERIEKKEGVSPPGSPRILISGCPMAAPNWKLPFLVEKNSGVIVGEESCVGERGTRNLVDTSGQTLDQLLDAIADRYLQIDCAVFTPNRERIDHVREMAGHYRADGVIHYGIQFCTPYAMEAHRIERAIKDDGLPILRVETDYSSEDTAQIETRVQAFLELIGEGARKGEKDGRQIAE
jgi:benzoyl-CoA reductase/2-hydroxyglutaryl-CoA dehydratase subunit BcrC/BadD/HgdB